LKKKKKDRKKDEGAGDPLECEGSFGVTLGKWEGKILGEGKRVWGKPSNSEKNGARP